MRGGVVGENVQPIIHKEFKFLSCHLYIARDGKQGAMKSCTHQVQKLPPEIWSTFAVHEGSPWTCELSHLGVMRDTSGYTACHLPTRIKDVCKQALKLLFFFSFASSSSPDFTVQNVVMLQFLGCSWHARVGGFFCAFSGKKKMCWWMNWIRWMGSKECWHLLMGRRREHTFRRKDCKANMTFWIGSVISRNSHFQGHFYSNIHEYCMNEEIPLVNTRST